MLCLLLSFERPPTFFTPRDDKAAAGGDYYAKTEDGYDQSGYDQSGYDQSGYDQSGYDQSGYDQSGYDEAAAYYDKPE